MVNEDRRHFDCATWLHKAREMPKEQFKRESEFTQVAIDERVNLVSVGAFQE